jgi:hypothetical protein
MVTIEHAAIILIAAFVPGVGDSANSLPGSLIEIRTAAGSRSGATIRRGRVLAFGSES